MRKITQQAVNAFYSGESFSKDNTKVYVNDAGENCFKLHKTVIARINWNGKLWLNTDGWTSNTTKERLNGVLAHVGAKIFQKNFTWYILLNDGNVIDFIDGIEIKL